jgi:3-isopropylmalate/(R)-2-methylmalate dehydratase large subunit
MSDSKPTTLYDKIWNDHLVHEADDGTCLIYIDRHLVHEVTSPQAFEGLRATGRKVHAPEKTLAVVDHNIPTTDRSKPNPDPASIEQMRVMADNAREFGITYYDEHDIRQGIVHIIGPEQGFTLPGTPSCAATATPRPMARSARWRMASAPRKWSMCWRPRR